MPHLLTSRIQRLERQSNQFAQWRVVVVVGGIIGSLGAFYAFQWRIAALLLVATVFGFAGLVTLHRRVDHALLQLRLWQKLKQTHRARQTLDWQHIPTPPNMAHDPQHPFELDIDIDDLHRLLDTSVSLEGSQRLRAWLLNQAPDLATIQQHQQWVQTLQPLGLFRDKLTLQAWLTGSEQHINGTRLQTWFETEMEDVRQPVRASLILTTCTAILFVLSGALGLPPLWLLSFGGYMWIRARHWRPVAELSGQAINLYGVFRRMQRIFGYLEHHRYHELNTLLEPFQTEPPSRYFRRLNRILTAISVQQNPLLGFAINLVVPWDLFFADRLNRCRGAIAEHMPTWLGTWYELEALNALANFADLHPDYSYPMVRAEGGLAAHKMGHPLIASAHKVCNDFHLDRLGEVVIITGSNMAGKSTFLRTLGVNLVLAYAGAPVNAAQFETGLYRLYSCIRVTDSLNDGISYFYAEVKRLKGLLNHLGAQDGLPVFFLIDEIFRGTNNRERLIGSRSFIKALVQQNGFGLIATHDLELVKLADDMPTIHNAHFREEVQAGRMVFDYTLRQGPCPTTNALKIMAQEGLPIEDEA
ncbi:MAG: hypothetical protein H6673_14295 [Anaerolineales bacterium]|nr:hypothetical protein [Anaerolineales bacterium]